MRERELPEAHRAPDGSRLSPSGPGARAIYAAGLTQGLVLVGPAASGQVVRPEIGDARYGAIFLPLVIGAVIGALAAPAVAGARGAVGALGIGFVLNVIGSVALAASELVLDQASLAFAVLCLACGLIGLGFGLSIAALNVLAIDRLPGRSAAAVAAVHMTLGIGSVIGPVLVGLLAGWKGAVLVGDGPWWLVPVLGAAGAVGVLAVLGGVGHRDRSATPAGMQFGDLPARLLLFAAIALAYGGIEALFINWSAIYVKEDLGGSDAIAGLALAAFFGAMAAARLVFALASLRRPLRFLLVASPLAGAGAFAVMAGANSAPLGVFAAALGGVTLAPLFVYLLSLAALEFSDRRTTVSGLMMAALMAGAGLSAIIVGVLRAQADLDTIFLAGGGISVLLAVAVVLLRPAPQAA